MNHNVFHSIWKVHTEDMTYRCGCWTWSPGWGSVWQVSPLQSCIFPLFYTVLFGKKVSMYSPHLRGVELWSSFLRVEYIHILFEIIFHARLFSSFIQSFIYISISSSIFYTVGYNTILLYFVLWIVSALAIGSPFSWFLVSVTSSIILCVHVFTHFSTFWHENMLPDHIIYFLSRNQPVPK